MKNHSCTCFFFCYGFSVIAKTNFVGPKTRFRSLKSQNDDFFFGFGRLTYSQIVRTFSKNHELLAKVANSQNASIIMILQSPNADEGKRRTDRHIFDSGEKKKSAGLFARMKSVILTTPQ